MTGVDVLWVEMHPALTHLANHFTADQWAELAAKYRQLSLSDAGIVRGMKAGALAEAAAALGRYADLCSMWDADNDR